MGTRMDNTVSVLIGVAALTVAVSVGYRTFIGVQADVDSPLPRAVPALDPADWWDMVRLARPLFGDPADRVTVVEFTDLECPACRVFHNSLRSIPADSLAGVRFLVMHFPLPMHRFALPASRALECAAETDHTLQFVDVVYAHQDSIGLLSWGAIARRAGIQDTARITNCALDPTPVACIAESVEFGNRIGVTGTPTLFVNGVRLPAPTRMELLRAIAATQGRNP